MFINSHLATGYILHKSNLFEKKWLPIWVLSAWIPDIDGFWSASVVEHHSILHTQVFWIVICAFGWLVGYYKKSTNVKTFFIILFIGTFVHLLTDYITARTVGIKWLYPFNDVDYFLYPIIPENGNIPIWQMLVPPYLTFYFENKLLFLFEILLNIIALGLYFFSYKKPN